MTGTSLPRLLTVAEVADLLNVPKSWVYEHTRPGRRDQLPSVKLGRYRRFRLADVEAFIEHSMCTSTLNR